MENDFTQIIYSGGENVRPDSASGVMKPQQRLAQLEKRLSFVHHQHKEMLTDLHLEIQTLKNRNRG